MQESLVAEPPIMEAPKAKVSALEARALRAAIWTIISYGSSQALRVVNSLVLTHLLMPSAFGEMALVMTLIVGMTLLSDIGLGPSVIQSTRGDEADFLNTAWTIQAGRGMTLWVVSLVLAWPAARFYHDPALLRVLPVLALCTIITGFYSTGLLTLSRHMGVRRLFFLDFSTQLVSLIVTVAWALKWPSVWALVAGNIVSNLYRLTISHNKKIVPGVSNRFCWHRPSVKDIVHFGKWIFLGTAFYFFASQADRLVLGKLVSMAVLGVYGIAFQISDVPRSIINAFAQRVSFPFISRLTHLPLEEFRRQFLRYRGYTLLLGSFLLAIMAVWGDLIITRLYKPAYHDAAWMVPILALGLWHTLLYTTTQPVLFAMGKSGYNAVGNAVYGIAMFAGIPLAYMHWHLVGAIVAIAAGDLPLYIVFQFGATREGIKPLWQDLQLTLALLGFLLIDFLLRRTF